MERHFLQNEDGYILIMVMVTLMLLVVLGVTSTTTTTVEVQIAGNDKVNKVTFYEADGGTELGGRLVEENVSCPNGFTATPSDPDGKAIINSNIAIPATSLTFWQNESAGDPSESNRDIYYPTTYASSTAVHTNIVIGGQSKYLTGSAIQMVAGYEGKGKGAAAGGGFIQYDVVSQRTGESNSKAEVEIVWRHVIGLEGECNY